MTPIHFTDCKTSLKRTISLTGHCSCTCLWVAKESVPSTHKKRRKKATIKHYAFRKTINARNISNHSFHIHDIDRMFRFDYYHIIKKNIKMSTILDQNKANKSKTKQATFTYIHVHAHTQYLVSYFNNSFTFIQYQ